MQVLLEKRDQDHGDMIIGDKVRTLLEVGPCQKQNMKICVANVLMFTLVSYILGKITLYPPKLYFMLHLAP